MRLGPKLALLLVVPLVGLTALFGYLYQQRSQELLREELAKEGRVIALLVQIAAEDYLRARQPAELRKLVDEITGYERVLGLRIFDREGALVYQSSSLDTLPFEHQALLGDVLRDGRSRAMRRKAGEQSLMGVLFPLKGRGARLEGAGQVLQLESYIESDSRANRDFIVALSLAMVVATASIVLFVTRYSVTRPVADLVHSFRRVGAADLTVRAPVRGDDELGRLAVEFNGMCDRLESARASLQAEQRIRQQTEDQLRNARRLAGLGRLAAGLAHEIGTPLNVISGRAESLRRHLAHDERAARNLDAITAQSDRIVRIVRDMLDFARMKSPGRVPVALEAVVRAALAPLVPEIEARGIAVHVDVPIELPRVIADANQLEQVVQNLIANARDAMPEGGALEISAAAVEASHPERGGAPGRYIRLVVADTGHGIAPEHREHVFDPFFTTKDPGRGMGLGLAVCYGIVEEHGGWFELENPPDRGTIVAAYLPVDSPPESAEETRT